MDSFIGGFSLGFCMVALVTENPLYAFVAIALAVLFVGLRLKSEEKQH